MKILLLITVFCFGLASFGFSQQNDAKQAQPTQAAPPTFKVSLIVDDIMFAANVINTVEITGSDVDAFLLTKNSLLNVVKYIQTNNSRLTDTLTLDIQFQVGKSLLGFMSKTRFQASQVENYRRFVEAINEGMKPSKPKESKGK